MVQMCAKNISFEVQMLRKFHIANTNKKFYQVIIETQFQQTYMKLCQKYCLSPFFFLHGDSGCVFLEYVQGIC